MWQEQEQDMSVSRDQLTPPSRTPASAIADYLRNSISISEILDRFWSGRLIIILTTLAFLVLGCWFIYSAGPTYVATMWVSPAEGDASGTGSASGLLAQLSGDGGATAVPKFTQFLSAIPSTGVAKDLDRKYDMVCKVFHGSCDQTTHQWHEQTGLMAWLAGLTAALGRLPDPNGARTPSDLANYISGRVTIEQNKKNSIVILTYADPKPQFAAQFLFTVVKASNDYIKALNHDNERRYVAYLANTVTKTTNVEQRQTLDTLLLQHERQLMMTEVDVPYAATILEGPSVTPVNRVLKMLLVYGTIGFVIGLLIAFFRRRISRAQHG
jgi:hypothetical protein